jgi:hypothetical protein
MLPPLAAVALRYVPHGVSLHDLLDLLHSLLGYLYLTLASLYLSTSTT